MNKLVNIQLQDIPQKLRYEMVASPISGQISSQIYGYVQVNDHQWPIVYCPIDDLWWVHPRPDATFYEALYTRWFYNSPIPEQFGYATPEVDGIRRTEKARKNWDDIEPYIKHLPKDTLLEIGCGSGEFLVEARNRGWKIVHGNELEITSAQMAKAKNLYVDTGFFENYSAPDSQGYELIFADNVIEHTMNPAFFVQKIHQLLQPTGCVILRLPDTQPFGPTLKLIDHTFHFTRTSIRKLLEINGFEIITIFHSGTFKGTKYDFDPQQRIENMTVVAKKLKNPIFNLLASIAPE